METSPVGQIEKSVSFDILTYQAPFLIEKLLKEAIVESAEEGELLFTEVKRWMLLVYNDKSRIWDMYSYRIDGVWHQFILFTAEYINFCDLYFGSYFSHYPGNAPGIDETDQSLVGSISEFEQLYTKVFNTELPDVWFDEKSITIQRRILNNNIGHLFLEEKDDMISMSDENGNVVLSVNLFASDAMTFIVSTKAFYVRELPGGLTDEEKIFLVRALVQFHILRVAC